MLISLFGMAERRNFAGLPAIWGTAQKRIGSQRPSVKKSHYGEESRCMERVRTKHPAVHPRAVYPRACHELLCRLLTSSQRKTATRCRLLLLGVRSATVA
jgi:hypothetical protein